MTESWCLPPGPDGAFVAAMEDVLDVYERPYDPFRPVVCVDEASKQLVGEVRDPLPPIPGHVAKADAEYVRNGTANIFIATEPLDGYRQVKVTDRRTKTDFACFIRDLLDGRYKYASTVVLVMDNLNTHSTASLYEAFAPAEAKRLADKLEIHHTPKHGSWLNIAECELSALGPVSAWTGGSPTRRRWPPRCRRGDGTATRRAAGLTGSSERPTPGSN